MVGVNTGCMIGSPRMADVRHSHSKSSSGYLPNVLCARLCSIGARIPEYALLLFVHFGSPFTGSMCACSTQGNHLLRDCTEFTACT